MKAAAKPLRKAAKTEQIPPPFGSEPLSRTLLVIAQDPSVTVPDDDKSPKILTAEVTVPCEKLADGPRGYRIHVVDYDASTRTLYALSAIM